MKTLLTLVAALRAPSLTAGAMPVIVLTAFASREGYAALWFWPTLLGMVAAQGAVNLINDYFDDASGLDADPEFAKNPFPLGSRVIQTGALSKRGVAIFAAVCAGIALACGVYLESVRGDFVVLGLAVAAGLLGYFYTAPPLRIAYHGAGEPVTFMLFGPLAGLGTYWITTGRVTPTALLLSSIVGWLAMAILYMHHFPQHDADRRHGKKTPIVRLGPKAAGKLVPWMLAVPFVALLGGIALGLLPPVAAFALVALPFAVRASRAALRTPSDPRAMTGAFASVFGLHFVSMIALAIVLALWKPVV